MYIAVRSIHSPNCVHTAVATWCRSKQTTKAMIIFSFLALFHNLVDGSVQMMVPFTSLESSWDWREARPYKDKSLAVIPIDVSRSQDREDIWLAENWFYMINNATIVESGAYNGYDFSNTYFYEHFAHWNIIHIEADPFNYHELRGNRPNTLNVHAALCQHPRILHYTTAKARNINGFVEFMDPGFMGMWHNDLVQNPQLIETLPKVMCVPIGNIFREIGLKRIDVWILDVEGAELEVLHGLDFSKVHISTIVMECDGGPKDPEKILFLSKHDYHCHLVDNEDTHICNHFY